MPQMHAHSLMEIKSFPMPLLVQVNMLVLWLPWGGREPGGHESAEVQLKELSP